MGFRECDLSDTYRSPKEGGSTLTHLDTYCGQMCQNVSKCVKMCPYVFCATPPFSPPAFVPYSNGPLDLTPILPLGRTMLCK